MNSIRKWIRNVFGFSGSEINGFLILIPLMLALIFSEPLYHSWTATRERLYEKDVQELDSLVSFWENQVETPVERPVVQEFSLFFFDPNTAAVEDLLRLGFSQRLAKRIAAYRQKGGVFRVKSDLMRIYELDSALYKRLYQYIRLPAQRATFKRADTIRSGRLVPKSYRKRTNVHFDINTADTAQLKTIYGIGPVLAKRIVKFRDGLGGFVSPGQLSEVYGLDSVVVKQLLAVSYIRPDFIPRQININTADEEKLAGHPYIRYRMARVLVNYRFQHGDFTVASDIKKVSVLKADEVDRLLPYLTVTD